MFVFVCVFSSSLIDCDVNVYNSGRLSTACGIIQSVGGTGKEDLKGNDEDLNQVSARKRKKFKPKQEQTRQIDRTVINATAMFNA